MTINNYDKMRRSNAKAKKWLLANNYSNIYLFPHSRFQKGYNIDSNEFDGVCTSLDTMSVVFFQTKSNMKAPKKKLLKYIEISKLYSCECLWINVIDRKGVFVDKIS